MPLTLTIVRKFHSFIKFPTYKKFNKAMEFTYNSKIFRNKLFKHVLGYA